MRNSVIPKNNGDLIASLSKLKTDFLDGNHKARIIEILSQKTISSAKQLIAYHEALCFMQAYPDSSALSHLVDSELQMFSERVEQYKLRNPADTKLDDTGIVETAIYYPYNLKTVRWLLARYKSAVDIDWDSYQEKENDPICGLLPLFAQYLENDGIDDEDSSTADWIKKALGRNDLSLAWLINRLDCLGIAPDVIQYMYDNAELMLRWNLQHSSAARTLAKLPGRRVCYQRGPIKKGKIDLNRSLKKRVPELKLLPRNSGAEIIDTLIHALLPRHRELYPATFANPDEIYITHPGRGIEMYILGMRPESRMPLESNYSALLIKNGVPIGYGIAVIFFERCELALNIFDTFRSGEAAFIFDHFTRVFYHHFGGRDFLMRRWQVGYENEEGLKSGSYWFYYKLGFRSIDIEVNAIAGKEWLKIQHDDKYRTDMKTLKALSASDMYISLGQKHYSPFHELSVIRLGFAITGMIANKFDGDRHAAQCWSTEHIASLFLIDFKGWTSIERLQFERFAPLLTLIKDLDTWSKGDKQDLVSIIRAKAAVKELDYIESLQRHKRFQAALESIASAT